MDALKNKETVKNFAALAEIQHEEDRLDKTLERFIARVGYSAAVETIATAVNLKAWDGRINPKNAAWAAEQTEQGKDSSEYMPGIDNIHPAHLDQLASYIRRMDPPEEPSEETGTYAEKVERALEMLRDDDELFADMVEELDNWDGFADGYRAYPMYEIDELFADMRVSDFLSKLSSDFNRLDEYFLDTIYGISSTDDRAAWYRDHTDEGELFDEIIAKRNHIYIDDTEFEELIGDIIAEREAA